MKVGTILRSSWGYDQTNVDFYQVVKATDKTVWLREIGGTETSTGWCTGTVVPDFNNFVTDEVIKRKICVWGDRDSRLEFVKIESYARAYEWTGRPERFSTYA